MATIVTIAASDQISNSRTDLNTNFANLNSDKIETSVIDTDTAMAANSDAKIPSQKAVKAYVDTLGNVNASATARGIVELATAAEINAGTATGGSGAALVVTPDTLKASQNPIVRTYLNAGSPATWTKPAGLKYVIVEVQAGGGTGANGVDNGADGRGGGGGGGGGYSKKLIAVATLGTTETVTTGAVGAASSFGAHATASAGADGSTFFGGAGGIGASGDVNLEGGDGATVSIGASVAAGSSGGHGGSSHYGGGGKGGHQTVSRDGSAGNVYGGGGGGGNGDSGGAGNGGAGAAGIVVVTEYYV